MHTSKLLLRSRVRKVKPSLCFALVQLLHNTVVLGTGLSFLGDGVNVSGRGVVAGSSVVLEEGKDERGEDVVRHLRVGLGVVSGAGTVVTVLDSTSDEGLGEVAGLMSTVFWTVKRVDKKFTLVL